MPPLFPPGLSLCYADTGEKVHGLVLQEEVQQFPRDPCRGGHLLDIKSFGTASCRMHMSGFSLVLSLR